MIQIGITHYIRRSSMYFLNANYYKIRTQSAGRLFHTVMVFDMKEHLRWLVWAGGVQYC